MSRIRHAALGALVALALLGAAAAAYPPGPSSPVADYPPGPTFNPQPDPPGAVDFPPGPTKTASIIVQDSPALFPPGPSETAGVIMPGSPIA
jgi:hypothetical protein